MDYEIKIDLLLTEQQVEFIKRYAFYGTDSNYAGRFLDNQHSFYWYNYKEYFHDVRVELIELGLIDTVSIDATYTKYRLTKLGERVWDIVRK